MNRFGLHLGVNFGAGIAGGTFAGGLLKIAPRVAIHYNKKSVFGLESSVDYQIVYLKDSIENPSIRLSKWIGPFFRYYFLPTQNRWNIMGSINYIYGSFYVFSDVEKYRKTYNTLFLGLGGSYKIKNILIEGGYRYTFLFNNTPIAARWTNSIFLGLTRNF